LWLDALQVANGSADASLAYPSHTFGDALVQNKALLTSCGDRRAAKALTDAALIVPELAAQATDPVLEQATTQLPYGTGLETRQQGGTSGSSAGSSGGSGGSGGGRGGSGRGR